MPSVELDRLNGGEYYRVQPIMNCKTSESRLPEEHADTWNAIPRRDEISN